MPEKYFKRLSERILPSWKFCFFATLFVGIVAHLYKITNWLPNWDSIVFRYDPQNMVNVGRWFLPVVCTLSSFYDLPFLNGIISILFHALSAVCICRMFNVEKKITAFLIGAVIVSFPTVTSVMMYNYVADGYSIAFFFSTLAAMFITQKKPKYILASVLIALAAGIYQAYITVTIMLLLLKLSDDLIHHNEEFLDALKKALRMALCGIAGVLLYSLILKIILKIFSMELLDYQGINQTASLSNMNLLLSLYTVKENFVKCFFDLSSGFNVRVLFNAFIFVFTGAYYLKCIVKNKIYKKPLNLLLILIVGVMLFVGAGALAFINAEVDYHNLMLMGYSVFYLFFILIYERGTEDKEKYSCIKSWIVLVSALVVVSNQLVISNVSYHKAQIAYEKSYGVLVRIADRIEQTEGAEDCEKILVIGALDDSDAYSAYYMLDITGITDGYIIRKDDEMIGQSVFCSALTDYCGKDYVFLSGDEKKELLGREEVQSMEKWPSKNCVAVVDDTVIIKLGTEGEN